MPHVLDCSMTMAIAMDDEVVINAGRVHARLTSDGAIVPPHWFFEVANALATAARRGRIGDEECVPRLALILALPIETENPDASRMMTSTLGLVIEHGLTVCDAAYLEVALRLSQPLATVDQPLAAAARSEGIEVIGR